MDEHEQYPMLRDMIADAEYVEVPAVIVRELFAERDRLRAELVQVREEHKVTWTDWKRQRRRAGAAGAERDHYHRFATMVGEIVRRINEDIPSIDVETLLRDMPDNVAAIRDERNRLRTAAQALLLHIDHARPGSEVFRVAGGKAAYDLRAAVAATAEERAGEQPSPVEGAEGQLDGSADMGGPTTHADWDAAAGEKP